MTHNNFINVFAIDQLKGRGKIRQKNWLLVCNSSPSNSIGLHWFSIYKENDIIEFFDSYGAPPSAYGLQKFIERQDINLCLHNSK